MTPCCSSPFLLQQPAKYTLALYEQPSACACTKDPCPIITWSSYKVEACRAHLIVHAPETISLLYFIIFFYQEHYCAQGTHSCNWTFEREGYATPLICPSVPFAPSD